MDSGEAHPLFSRGAERALYHTHVHESMRDLSNRHIVEIPDYELTAVVAGVLASAQLYRGRPIRIFRDKKGGANPL